MAAAALAVLLAVGLVLLWGSSQPWKKNVIPREEKALSVVWSYRARSFSAVEGMDVEAPTWLYVEADSLGKPVLHDLSDLGYESFNAKSYVEEAHEAGVKIWATVVSFEPELSRQVVTDEQSRREFAAALAQWVAASDADGVCFDFENMDPADKEKYTALVQAASDALGEKTVAVAVTVPLGFEDSNNWYQCYDRKGLAEAADYLALMAYDAHTGKEQPTAPLNWVRKAVERTLAEVPSNKLLLGIPFYGVDYTTGEDGKPKTLAVSALLADQLLRENRMDRENSSVIVKEWINPGSWHEEWAVMEYAFTDTDGNKHTLWMENETTLQVKGKLMDEYGLAGTAVWRKNQGTDTLWSALAKITAEENRQE